MSINAWSEEASCPLDWRLFIPAEWDQASKFNRDRRAKAKLPGDVHHVEKWRLALGMIDELIGWGVTRPVILGDGAYGDTTEFRSGLEERELSYVLDVKGSTSAYREDVMPTQPPRPEGRGRPPAPRYRENPSSLKQLALAAGKQAAVKVTWREGTRGKMSSRFLALRVRPATIHLRHKAHKAGEALPVGWLICEWPSQASEPTKYWLSNLPADTPLKELVHLGKLRWRIEHDYRELKDALGARSLRRPHLPRLEPPRHARIDRARVPDPGATTAPATQGGSLTLFQLVRELQALLACWHGTCATCHRRLPPDHPLRGPP